MSLYVAPDIRTQTIEEAEAFISQKRVRRLTTLYSYKQALADKLAKLKGDELVKFEKQKVRMDKAMENVVAALNKAESVLLLLQGTHNRLSNIESNEAQL